MNNKQGILFDDAYDDLLDFNSKYFVSHLITYIGNKRKLLPFINDGIIRVKKNLKKDKIVSLDGFSGSGVVARLLKYHSSKVISNDFEQYTKTVNSAYLANKSMIDEKKLSEAIEFLNRNKLKKTKSDYFITKNYAPKDDDNIKSGERVFFTNKNARIIDNVRYLIDHSIDENLKVFCLANLIIQASIHNNTSGVFKGFHKKDGLGHFGGRGENALARIKGEIALELPIFSEVECEVDVHCMDTNKLIREIEDVDLAYYDPPYNQHPYGSNYFMLNIINGGVPVEIQQGVSGIIKGWQRSSYNKLKPAIEAMHDLIKNTKSKYILISYNDEGIIPFDDFKRIIDKYGSWELLEQEYNTYRGSRNLKNRRNKVRELLWLLKKD